MPCCSSGRTRSSRRGVWSNPFSTTSSRSTSTNLAPGDLPKRTSSSPATAAGAIRRHLTRSDLQVRLASSEACTTFCVCLAALKAPALLLASEDDPHDLWLELFPHVADRARPESGRAPPRRLADSGHARRQPRVLDQVVHRVASIASPGRCETAVGPIREKHRVERVPQARTETLSTGRQVIGALAPDRAQAGLDRVGDADVRLALKISLARPAPRLPPLAGNVPGRVPRGPDDAHAEALGANSSVDDPLDALRAGHRLIGAVWYWLRGWLSGNARRHEREDGNYQDSNHDLI